MNMPWRTFCDYDPHANPKDAAKYPALHRAYVRTELLIFALLAFFVVHTCLWLLRSLVHVLQYGRHQRLTSEQRAVRIFSATHRGFHAVAVVSLLGLSATGLVMKHGSQEWLERIARYPRAGFACSCTGILSSARSPCCLP